MNANLIYRVGEQQFNDVTPALRAHEETTDPVRTFVRTTDLHGNNVQIEITDAPATQSFLEDMDEQRIEL